MGIKVYAMSDARFQPCGVAVHRTTEDIRKTVAYRLIGDEHNDAAIDSLALEYWHACETVELREFPPNGFFASRAEFEACCVDRSPPLRGLIGDEK